MSRQSDTLTVALTGSLFYSCPLRLSRAHCFVFDLASLSPRGDQVDRRRSRSAILEPKGFLPPEPEQNRMTPRSHSLSSRATWPGESRRCDALRRANRRQWVVAFVHIIAGCCFAAAMTSAFLTAGKMAFLPFRFMFITWANAWPILMAIDLVVGLSRRGKLIGALLYFLIGGVIGAVLLVKNPGLPAGQLLYIWLDSTPSPLFYC